MDHSPPGSSVHGILQIRTLEWVAMPSSKGPSWLTDWICLFYISCVVKWMPYHYCHLGSSKPLWDLFTFLKGPPWKVYGGWKLYVYMYNTFPIAICIGLAKKFEFFHKMVRKNSHKILVNPYLVFCHYTMRIIPVALGPWGYPWVMMVMKWGGWGDLYFGSLVGCSRRDCDSSDTSLVWNDHLHVPMRQLLTSVWYCLVLHV